MKFNKRADQVTERVSREKKGVFSESQLERAQLDTERMEQEIRAMNTDATKEDLNSTMDAIARVQSQVRSHMESTLSHSNDVVSEMMSFEKDSAEAAENARDDARRMNALKPQLHNSSVFEQRISTIQSQKTDGAHFQDTQNKQMKAADDQLQAVMRKTQNAVHAALSRSWK